jgi:hypothetical protein
MSNIVAGAFDAFANAKAAADDLQDSGFVPEGVQITSNPANPDGMPGSSIVDELGAIPGILERLFSNLLELPEQRESDRRYRDLVRSGGVLVLVPVAGDGEKVLARNILRIHRGFEVDYVAGGASLY